MIACALAAVLFAAPSNPATQILVIVQGEAAEVGRQQALLEAELDREYMRVPKDAAAKVGATPEPTPSNTQTQRAMTEIASAETAYGSADLTLAAAHVEEARKILATTTEPGATDARVLMHLWASTIALESGNREVAAQEIKNAFKIDPDPSVSTDTFPPEIVGYIDREKPKDTVMVTLSGLPPGATVLAGGTRLEKQATFGMERGKRIQIRAPQCKPAEILVPMDAPSTFARTVQLALALPPSDEAAVKAALAGTASATQLGALSRIMTLANVEALVLVEAKGTQSKAAVFLNGKVKGSRTGDTAALARFTVDTIRPPRTPLASGVVTRGGFIVSTWQRTLNGEKLIYRVPQTGTGPALSVEGAWRGLIASSELSVALYQLNPALRINVEQGNDDRRLDVTHGTSIRASLGVGYERPVGALLLGALVGGRYESYSTAPVELPSGEPLLPTSITLTGGEARVRVAAPVGPVRVHAALGAGLGLSWAEKPVNTTGKDPKAGLAPFVRLGGSWEMRDDLRIALDYGLEQRTVTLAGPPAVNRQGTVDNGDLTLQELLSTVSLSAAYRF